MTSQVKGRSKCPHCDVDELFQEWWQYCPNCGKRLK